MSLGGAPRPTWWLGFPTFTAARDAGVLMQAAAGNDATRSRCPGLVRRRGVVSAVDSTNTIAEFSNTGDNLSLVAPGDYVYPACHGVLAAVPAVSQDWTGTCWPQFDGEGGAHYAYVGGTSFAAPEVAGVAAQSWAVRPDLHARRVELLQAVSGRRRGLVAPVPDPSRTSTRRRRPPSPRSRSWRPRRASCRPRPPTRCRSRSITTWSSPSRCWARGPRPTATARTTARST
jgi:hypothetical protein